MSSNFDRANLPTCGIEPHRATAGQRKAIGLGGKDWTEPGYDRDRQRKNRLRVRQSHACECNGDRAIGRPYPQQTQGQRSTVFAWTGETQSGCPWWAFHDPFVARVIDAYGWFTEGQLATYAPRASHRLIEGVAHYHRALNLCRSKAMDMDREEAKKKRRG